MYTLKTLNRVIIESKKVFQFHIFFNFDISRLSSINIFLNFINRHSAIVISIKLWFQAFKPFKYWFLFKEFELCVLVVCMYSMDIFWEFIYIFENSQFNFKNNEHVKWYLNVCCLTTNTQARSQEEIGDKSPLEFRI